MTEPVRKRSFSLAECLARELSNVMSSEIMNGLGAGSGGRLPPAEPVCVLTASVRVRVPSTGFVACPDVSVVRGALERDEDDPTTIVNPVLLADVLSPGAESLGRRERAGYYRRIPSVREYVIVWPHEGRIEHHIRKDDGTWTQQEVRPSERLRLGSLGCEFSVDEVFVSAMEPAGGG